jgi:hypothetical protein
VTGDFRHLDDLEDFVLDLIRDTAIRLDADDMTDDIVHRVDRSRDPMVFSCGLDTAMDYDHQTVRLLTADRMRRTVLADCVEAARRRLRTAVIGYPGNRVIGLISRRERNPLWSCHADLLVLSAFLARGYDRSQIGLLGQGSAVPAKGARNAYPGTIVDPFLAINESPFHQHYVRDGSVHAHVSVGLGTDTSGPTAYGPVEILSDHRSAVSVAGYELPDTVLTALAGQPLRTMLSHPVTDRIPGLRILEARRSEGNSPGIFVTLERRRTFLAKAPRGTDLSFAELGNDILAEIGETPVTVLPYEPSMHLSSL